MNLDPSAMRRRARRRLVGAIAIALVGIVVVPMLFDPDPKPLGSDVDIRIPSQDSTFEASPSAGTKPPEDVAVAPTGAESATSNGQPNEATATAEPTPTSTPPKAPVPPPVQEAKKTAPKPTAESKKPEPVQPKSDPVFASKGYYLQLGAFTSEGNAKALLTKVKAAGFNVGMTDANGQYRVRVGPIQERDKAMDMLSKLRSKGFSPVILGP